jgi:hypothetical protein
MSSRAGVFALAVVRRPSDGRFLLTQVREEPSQGGVGYPRQQRVP